MYKPMAMGDEVFAGFVHFRLIMKLLFEEATVWNVLHRTIPVPDNYNAGPAGRL